MMTYNISQTSNTYFRLIGHSFMHGKPAVDDGNSDDVVGKSFPLCAYFGDIHDVKNKERHSITHHVDLVVNGSEVNWTCYVPWLLRAHVKVCTRACVLACVCA